MNILLLTINNFLLFLFKIIIIFNFETALLIFAIADEKCLTNIDECEPTRDNKNELLNIKFRKKNKKGKIYDIVLRMRYLDNEDERKRYYRNMKYFSEAMDILKVSKSNEDFSIFNNNADILFYLYSFIFNSNTEYDTNFHNSDKDIDNEDIDINEDTGSEIDEDENYSEEIKKAIVDKEKKYIFKESF
ncbi:hypothetical protein BCR32DRAFT_247931 [Anaeromyces robustus]|uniref:Uncharacterized protein n=1 Tax=Anaeromyces robustus TaxID=1754192 RepID=A0A1Y1WV48_9FUNG|nr:hypothetical protein BCR32DRAFT_247931 [Anaeromyces robustus]|eukprot:ORX77427.1 hypothetical protein BCR32DRAFT_247931 [Anaeromyces robustus]